MIYLDNAATSSPKPNSVATAVSGAIRNYSANPGRAGHKAAQSALDAVYSARQAAAEFFNAPTAENAVFTPNCTTALNIAIQGTLSNTDHAIISPFEHNAVVRPLYALGLSYDVAEFSSDAEKMLENFHRLIRPNTKAIICTHASNVFGIKMPIEALGELCKKYGLKFIVDAAQTAGIFPIDVQEMGISTLCIAAHKGLYAPVGAGLMITDATPKPLIFGGTGGDSLSPMLPDYPPEKFESGTVNIPTIVGIHEGIKFVKRNGENMRKKEMRQILHAEQTLSKMPSVTVYTDRKNADFAPVLSFNVNGMHSVDVAKMLDRHGICVRAGLHCAPLAHKTMGTLDTGTVRAAVSAFTKDNEIDYFLQTVKKISKQTGGA